LKLAPDIQSIPARIAAKTRDVPRSGCSITSASGGPTRRHAPRIVEKESSLDRRDDRKLASTTIIRTLASSLNWNVNGPTLIHRAEPPTPSPIARVRISRPSWNP
jgi:hypothetical protein